MSFRFYVLFFCVFPSFIFSSATLALSCSDVTNQIHADSVRYSENFQNQHLPWMQLSWLKQNLGIPEKNIYSRDRTQYKWKCSEDENNVLSVIKNKNGELTEFYGQYSSEEGSGVISIARNTSSEQPQPAISHKPTRTALSSHYDLIKQISNDFEEYS